MFLHRDELDVRIWKPCPMSAFSLRSFYKELEDVLEVRFTSSLVCLGLTPPRVESFASLEGVSGEQSKEERHAFKGYFRPMCALQEIGEDDLYPFLQHDFSCFM